MPQIGVVTVVVSSVAVTTQVYWVGEPCRSPIIPGSAVATTVLLSVETNRASSRPVSDFRTLRRDGAVLVLMRPD
ncbi:hypothetical protein GCM10017774_31620 [Lentzea cavernae]|uniref:Secreted protein n=1 Tax=Lentzea cavernae TaxID=2020703 RepID=A0ABQ3MCP7_9PSEU|nr:hypothetical protein GCM10017774_31620 [Lentzea cavernae]